MTKQGGLGSLFFVDGVDLSGDSNTIAIASPLAWQDTTGMDKYAMERTPLGRDGSMAWGAFFNPALAAAHKTLSPLPTADRCATFFHGATLGNAAASQMIKQIDYNPTRNADGSMTIAVTSQANRYGNEWGLQLTAGKRSDVAATNGTGVDFADTELPASSTFGLQAWLQVFSFTGTSCTVKLQQSSDNGVGDAWADVVGGGFVAATAIGSQRIETARGLTVERYLRAVTTGTFSQCTFAVMANRNTVLTEFAVA